ncbi:MAG: hypothetical protein AB7U63_15835, partial [Porticoccaceae bacterium]
MAYDYADDYVDVIPQLPNIDFTSPENARKNLLAAYEQNKVQIDESGVDIKDIFIDRVEDSSKL